jgi:putative copper resistance protein D
MARRAGDPGWAAAARLATLRFSTVGIASVGALLLTGIANTWFLAGTVPALVGTGYGRLLLLKIALFLAMVSIAAVNRLRLTPRLAPVLFGRKRETTWAAAGQLQRNALVEAALGLGVVAIVGALGALPPALHQQPWWPFPYRISLEVLTDSPALRAEAIETGAIALIGLVLLVRGLRRTRWVGAAAGLALLAGFGWRPVELMLVEAHPTSFQRSPVPFTAMAVARGERAFVENCAPCHGADGRGDGPLAKGLPVPPADLTAPHVLAHPEGDLFWWIGNGFPDGVMPGFADSLGERQRWEVVQFIEARAAAAAAHGLGASVAPGVGAPAPDFSFEGGDAAQDSLKDAVAQGPVLLVFFDPRSTARLDAIAHWQHHHGGHGLRILAVPLDGPEESQAPPAAPLPDFVVTTDPEVPAAYALYDHPETTVPLASPVEFLIDRTGHVRARWHPGDAPDWGDLDALQRMADAMSPLEAAPMSHAGHVH